MTKKRAKPPRLIISEKREVTTLFEGMPLDQIRESVNKLINEHGASATLESVSWGHDGPSDLEVRWTRVESDEEYAARLSKNERQIAEKDAADRAIYEKLRKKFDRK